MEFFVPRNIATELVESRSDTLCEGPKGVRIVLLYNPCGFLDVLHLLKTRSGNFTREPYILRCETYKNARDNDGSVPE